MEKNGNLKPHHKGLRDDTGMRKRLFYITGWEQEKLVVFIDPFLNAPQGSKHRVETEARLLFVVAQMDKFSSFIHSLDPLIIYTHPWLRTSGNTVYWQVNPGPWIAFSTETRVLSKGKCLSVVIRRFFVFFSRLGSKNLWSTILKLHFVRLLIEFLQECFSPWMWKYSGAGASRTPASAQPRWKQLCVVCSWCSASPPNELN